jgi:hypothetical protein
MPRMLKDVVNERGAASKSLFSLQQIESCIYSTLSFPSCRINATASLVWRTSVRVTSPGE